MPARLPDLPKLLAAVELKPVWLIAGAEHLLAMEAADRLRARARELGYLEREIHDVDARFDWNELAMAGASMSLFASKRLIELRMPSGKPGKEGSAAISAWCANPPPDTLLLISCQEWSKAHEGAWFNAVEKVGVALPIWPLKREEMPGWIAARLKARGIKAHPDAIELLVERVEGNLLAAAQEIDKLSLLIGEGVLNVETLEASVADDARFDAFRLTDAAIAGDAARALRMVAGLRAEGAEAIPLMGWLLNQLRVLYRLASAANLAQAFKTERIWDAKQPLFKRALKSGDAMHWQRCIVKLGHIDRMAKGRGDGDVWRELERLIAAIAMPRRAASLLGDS
ncbi:MAG: DNA polymerase III subunit delta [Dokdonella sp.]|mgnify:FL=1|uniref:DNA polymerase III subunit delta n=1 Tax=Dokdonella sp. TaxID=2291710 RepID=UPI0025C03CB3|nr:DNA polymerase III subunit delta [Dokdonella sp.]MBK8124610.1 DNA polymerase III subunit delta [Dokdonella sp.]HQX33585.1 DNA polymerase III subunit delta [Dokdonella sp.]